MVDWEIKYTKKAINDSQLLKSNHLDVKTKQILNIIRENPYGNPPPFEKLKADLCGKYSRRINLKHRIVYSVNKDNKVIIVYGMFSHYGEWYTTIKL